MKKALENYAFIDSQNLNLGIRDQGWELDFYRFRIYLRKKYGVAKAYMFLGYLQENERMYDALKRYGYELVFKPVVRMKNNEVKGNVDAELVLQAMIDYQQYAKAVIVTGDGDFYCLVKYLNEQGKLLKLLVPNQKKHSALLRKAISSPQYIAFVNPLRHLVEHKKQHP
jgi:uncharacterized LabA/DUF88 family protein